LARNFPRGRLGERPRVGFAVEELLQDLPRRQPAYVGDDRGQFAIGVLKDGLQPIGEPGSLVDQVDAIAREVAQVTLSGGGDTAGRKLARTSP
jgi:hypothetical protein